MRRIKPAAMLRAAIAKRVADPYEEAIRRAYQDASIAEFSASDFSDDGQTTLFFSTDDRHAQYSRE